MKLIWKKYINVFVKTSANRFEKITNFTLLFKNPPFVTNMRREKSQQVFLIKKVTRIIKIWR